MTKELLDLLESQQSQTKRLLMICLDPSAQQTLENQNVIMKVLQEMLHRSDP